jgi:hypothetical protein
MSRAPRPLAVLAVGLLLTACGSSAPVSSGASSNYEKGLKFAQCMRTNGVSAFPDPTASGNLTIDQIANGSSVDTSSPAWRHAIGVCKGLEPAGFTGHKRSAQQQGVAVEFAQCIRNHGVPDFPDPTPNSPLVDTNRIPSAATSSGRSLLRAAMQTCGALYGGELGVRR